MSKQPTKHEYMVQVAKMRSELITTRCQRDNACMMLVRARGCLIKHGELQLAERIGVLLPKLDWNDCCLRAENDDPTPAAQEFNKFIWDRLPNELAAKIGREWHERKKEAEDDD